MEKKLKKKIVATLSLTVLTAAIVAASIIMVKGAGLNPALDFGAGAYYYADIPDFDKLEPRSNALTQLATSLPLWAYILIFLAWGALMYWIWTKIPTQE